MPYLRYGYRKTIEIVSINISSVIGGILWKTVNGWNSEAAVSAL